MIAEPLSTLPAAEGMSTDTWARPVTLRQTAYLYSALMRRQIELYDKVMRHEWQRGGGPVLRTGNGNDERMTAVDRLSREWLQTEISGLIAAFEAEASMREAGRVRERVWALRDMFKAESACDEEISVDSLRGFLTFLRLNPGLRCPEIALTPEGGIYAKWRRAADTLFSLFFLSDGMVRFVVFCPNPRHPRITNRGSGTDAVDTVLETVGRSYPIRSWMSE